MAGWRVGKRRVVRGQISARSSSLVPITSTSTVAPRLSTSRRDIHFQNPDDLGVMSLAHSSGQRRFLFPIGAGDLKSDCERHMPPQRFYPSIDSANAKTKPRLVRRHIRLRSDPGNEPCRTPLLSRCIYPYIKHTLSIVRHFTVVNGKRVGGAVFVNQRPPGMRRAIGQ